MNDTNPTKGDEAVWKRRGLFAAAAALVATVMAKVTEQPIQAANGGPVLLGATNTSTGNTIVSSGGDNIVAFTGDVGAGVNVTGIMGTTNASQGKAVVGLEYHENGPTIGVWGAAASDTGVGVFGSAAAAIGFTVGVKGESRTPTGIGVLGRSVNLGNPVDGVGVQGESGGGIAVFGVIRDTSTKNAVPVYGLNLSSFAGPGPGAGGFGVYGFSAKGHGLVGATGAAGAAAVAGATNGVAGAYAGLFYGPVLVSGAFTVVGAKSAAVPHPDGSHRRLYCVESPESWFEDFGKGQLAGGCADVTVDPDFAAVVDLTDYHVFLTAYGRDTLYVTAQTPEGFHVEAQDATSATRFSWRLVAKRKDIAGPRFESVHVPPEPTLPSVPEVPAATPPPIRSH